MIYYASKNLLDSETQYSHVEKLALATINAIQKFRHYILLRTTTVLVDQNPMYYILTRQVLGGKYSRWIVILQEFDLDISKANLKKSLVFAELMCDLPCALMDSKPSDSFPDEFMFLISIIDREDCCHICHHTKYYLMLNYTFYRRGIDTIIRRCLTHDEDEQVLNDYHSGACGSHLSGMATTQKILSARYFRLSIFKYFHEVVKKFPPYQLFYPKKRTHPAPLHPVIVVGPFTKWGIDFMHCNPTSTRGHDYIIVVVDYFTKWA